MTQGAVGGVMSDVGIWGVDTMARCKKPRGNRIDLWPGFHPEGTGLQGSELPQIGSMLGRQPGRWLAEDTRDGDMFPGLLSLLWWLHLTKAVPQSL